MSFTVKPIHPSSVKDTEAKMEHIGVDSKGIKLMSSKARFFLLEIHGLPPKAGVILKQEALAVGAEAALPKDLINYSRSFYPAIIMGTEKQLKRLIGKLRLQPFKLPELGNAINEVLENYYSTFPPLRLGNHKLPLGERTLIMGILNVTPDSFSDGGLFYDPKQALTFARTMVDNGVDIIDVGGESTRPGHIPISEDEELRRIVPVIRALKKEVNVPVSVDTYKASVAEKALKEGAQMINDVWGGKADQDMLKVAARYKVPICLMHNRQKAVYDDLMREIIEDLQESLVLALNAGVEPHNIIIDPGIGFGKTAEHNLIVMKHLRELKGLGYPLLLGTSRKSMIGKVLNLPLEERVEGTAATVAYGITEGANLVRVHDIKEMVRVARMTDAMIRR